jgi:hypothetical protein
MRPVGAYWGHFAAKNVETSTNSLIQNDSGLAQGLAGCSAAIARLPLPAYHAAPAAPTNLIKHHAVDLDVPIACGEVPVSRRHHRRR